MLITNHVVSGALIGRGAPGPVSAFLVGMGSHFVLDMVPHWGDEAIFLKVAVADGLVGLAAMAVIAGRTPAEHRTRVVAGMLGACLPDADKPSELFFGRSPFTPGVDAWHKRIQRESPSRLPQEVVVAGIGAVALGSLLRRDRSR